MTPRPFRQNARKHWRNEDSGVLSLAVIRYLHNPNEMTLRDIAYMRKYFRQWIEHPTGNQTEIAQLRARLDNIRTPNDIRMWLLAASEVGIDPL
jgi:hypothetical protein